MKHTFTPEKSERIFKSMQNISVFAEFIGMEFQIDLTDTKFINPAINQHSKRIKESATSIQTHVGGVIKNKDKEFFTYEYCTALYELFTYFTTMPLEGIQDTLNQIEELKKQSA